MAGALLADAGKGALAGAVATRAMGKVTTFLYEHQDEAVTRREDEARGDRHAPEVAAEKIARLAGRRLNDGQRRRMGTALHWVMALGGGAVYGVLRRRVPGATLGAGLLFGVVFWLAADEVMNAVFKFTPGPRAFPWQTHARGLAGHVAYGVAAELQLRGAEKVIH